MIYCALIRHRLWISSIKQSLRVLELNTPTSKSEIKKRYLIMAKKYHPDSADGNGGKVDAKETSKNKEMQQKFVHISKAYQYLRDYTDEEINANKEKEPVKDSKTTTASDRANQRLRKTTEQMQRQQTYEYFNRRYYQETTNTKSQDQEDDIESIRSREKRLPLYKTVPELFLGFLLLAVLLGDWAYRVHKRRKQAKPELEPGQDFDDDREMHKVFKNMNHKALFMKGQPRERQPS